jgi:hypothetical protein
VVFTIAGILVENHTFGWVYAVLIKAPGWLGRLNACPAVLIGGNWRENVIFTVTIYNTFS